MANSSFSQFRRGLPALCSEQIPHETRVILRALLYRYPTLRYARIALWLVRAGVGSGYGFVRIP